jgi:hypothetical protein
LKTPYYNKYFFYYSGLKKRFENKYNAFKINNKFNNFFLLSNCIKNIDIYSYNVLHNIQILKKKLKIFFLDYFIIKFNIEYIQNSLIKFKKDRTKIFIKNLINSKENIIFIYYIILFNKYSKKKFKNMNEFNTMFNYYKNILEYKNLYYYKNHYIRLNKIYNNVYKKNCKKLKKIVKYFRNQIVYRHYISYSGKKIFEHHIDLQDINDK